MNSQRIFNRFLLFIIMDYEEAGGLQDVHSTFRILGDAVAAGRRYTGICHYFYVFDCLKRQIVHDREQGVTPYENIKGTVEYRRAHSNESSNT